MGVRYFWRKYHPRLRNPPRFGDLAQALFGLLICVQKPKDTVWNLSQNFKPTVKGKSTDFVRAIEAAEYECILRQTRAVASRPLSCYYALAVIWLVTRKPDDFLRIINFKFWRNYPIVGDNILVV